MDFLPLIKRPVSKKQMRHSKRIPRQWTCLAQSIGYLRRLTTLGRCRRVRRCDGYFLLVWSVGPLVLPAVEEDVSGRRVAVPCRVLVSPVLAARASVTVGCWRRSHEPLEQPGTIGRGRMILVVTCSLKVPGSPDHDQLFDPLVTVGHRLGQHKAAQATLKFGTASNDGYLAGASTSVVASSRIVSSCWPLLIMNSWGPIGDAVGSA